MTDVATTIMSRLKEATAEDHRRAERHRLQQALVRGQASSRLYASYLAQLLHVHRHLEAHLRRLRAEGHPSASVIRDEQFQVARLEADLTDLDCTAEELRPLPATLELIDAMERACRRDAVYALGFHYVLEGSTNGNRIIARVLRRALGLTGTTGTRYLDPYGERQAEMWARFKADMSAVAFTDAQQAGLIAAARTMFAGIVRIADELMAATEEPLTAAAT